MISRNLKYIGLGVLAISLLPSIAFANARSFDVHIKEASEKYGVPFVIIKGIIATESSFNPEAAASTSSARGLMQMTRGAASDVGASFDTLYNPRENIFAGTAYLSRMIKSYGMVGGIQAYYMGPGNYNKKVQGKSSQTITEGVEYSYKVMGYAAAFVLDIGTWT